MDENLIKLIGCFDYDRMKKQCQKYDLTKVTEIDNKSEEQLETYEMTPEEEIKWLRQCVSDLQQERDEYKQIIDKAIEYIKNTNFWGIYEDTPMEEVKYGEELLEILKESDNNE